MVRKMHLFSFWRVEWRGRKNRVPFAVMPEELAGQESLSLFGWPILSTWFITSSSTLSIIFPPPLVPKCVQIADDLMLHSVWLCLNRTLFQCLVVTRLRLLDPLPTIWQYQPASECKIPCDLMRASSVCVDRPALRQSLRLRVADASIARDCSLTRMHSIGNAITRSRDDSSTW